MRGRAASASSLGRLTLSTCFSGALFWDRLTTHAVHEHNSGLSSARGRSRLSRLQLAESSQTCLFVNAGVCIAKAQHYHYHAVLGSGKVIENSVNSTPLPATGANLGNPTPSPNPPHSSSVPFSAQIFDTLA